MYIHIPTLFIPFIPVHLFVYTARRSLDAAFIGFALAGVVGDLVEFFNLKREHTISIRSFNAKRLAHFMVILLC